MDVDVKKFLKIKFFFCYLKTCLIENQNLQRNHERCKTKLTDHPPPPSPSYLRIGSHMILQNLPQILLVLRINFRILCIWNRKDICFCKALMIPNCTRKTPTTSEIKVTTVKISEHINLFKIIRWT